MGTEFRTGLFDVVAVYCVFIKYMGLFERFWFSVS